MTILAIDYGEKRIGISISDPGKIISLPQEPIMSKGIKNDSLTISKLIENNNIELVVLGLPLTLNGDFGFQAKFTSNFEKELKKQTSTPIIKFDERFTTKQAKDISKNSKKANSKIDSIAASIMLQTYLDSRRDEKLI
ncbi:MAG: Holliday junction resolvase RuvX [Dehalococcoidia bacterium]|jgi:putative Holliday junction resolvase|nr:Holliday junction resolvase RuvX [Dehalococcoidia bacterium]|tara:strand:- start:48 stop:461 length:414 start_codon:yes stop_codon:yes gene_type:complete